MSSLSIYDPNISSVQKWIINMMEEEGMNSEERKILSLIIYYEICLEKFVIHCEKLLKCKAGLCDQTIIMNKNQIYR